MTPIDPAPLTNEQVATFFLAAFGAWLLLVAFTRMFPNDDGGD